MNFAAPPPSGAQINDISAINAVITHPDIFGPNGAIVDVQDRLVVTSDGIAVCFRPIFGRIHECHQAVTPEKRGRSAIGFMKNLADWWWETQPSDTVLGPVPVTCPAARFTMTPLGFRRVAQQVRTGIDGIPCRHVIYRLDRPHG